MASNERAQPSKSTRFDPRVEIRRMGASGERGERSELLLGTSNDDDDFCNKDETSSSIGAPLSSQTSSDDSSGSTISIINALESNSEDEARGSPLPATVAAMSQQQQPRKPLRPCASSPNIDLPASESIMTSAIDEGDASDGENSSAAQQHNLSRLKPEAAATAALQQQRPPSPLSEISTNKQQVSSSAASLSHRHSFQSPHLLHRRRSSARFSPLPAVSFGQCASSSSAAAAAAGATTSSAVTPSASNARANAQSFAVRRMGSQHALRLQMIATSWSGLFPSSTFFMLVSRATLTRFYFAQQPRHKRRVVSIISKAANVRRSSGSSWTDIPDGKRANALASGQPLDRIGVARLAATRVVSVQSRGHRL